MFSPKQAVQPNPSYPALCRQDTTSPWSTDYGGNSYTLILMSAIKTYLKEIKKQKKREKKRRKKGKEFPEGRHLPRRTQKMFFLHKNCQEKS